MPYEKIFLDYSVLGAISLILMGVSYSLFKLLLQEKDKRREDAEKYNDGLLEPVSILKRNGELQITLQQQVLTQLTSIGKVLKI